MRFSDILGQNKAIDFLKASIKNNRLSHCYLFTGPNGVGKKTTALALAQYLTCLNKTNSTDSCGICSSCIKNINHEHADVTIIEPDNTSIKIRQIKDLLQNAFYKSFEGGAKIIIINDCHLLTIEASNALLKILEEPRENTIFILITHQPSLLPQTILSRVQTIHFSPLESSIIANILSTQNYVNAQKISILANGSLTNAIELCTNEDILNFRTESYNFLATLSQKSHADIIFFCANFDKNRALAQNFIVLAQNWYHDILLFSLNNTQNIVNTDYLNQFSILPLQSLTYILKLIHTSSEQLKQNVSPRLILEVLLLKIHNLF